MAQVGVLLVLHGIFMGEERFLCPDKRLFIYIENWQGIAAFMVYSCHSTHHELQSSVNALEILHLGDGAGSVCPAHSMFFLLQSFGHCCQPPAPKTHSK